MNKITAFTTLEVCVNCPHCDCYQDIYNDEDVKYELGYSLRTESCDITITCEKCNQTFVVSQIAY